MPAAESLYDRVIRLMRASGRYGTIRELVRASGLVDSTLSELKARTKTNPHATLTADKASKLASALGVTVDELLGKAEGVSAPARIVDRDARYPMRAAAIEVFLKEGLPSADVEAAADMVGVALQSDDDPGFDWWRSSIKDALATLKRLRQTAVRMGAGARPSEDE